MHAKALHMQDGVLHVAVWTVPNMQPGQAVLAYTDGPEAAFSSDAGVLPSDELVYAFETEATARQLIHRLHMLQACSIPVAYILTKSTTLSSVLKGSRGAGGLGLLSTMALMSSWLRRGPPQARSR